MYHSYKKAALLWTLPIIFFLGGVGFWLATQLIAQQHQTMSKQLTQHQTHLEQQKDQVANIIASKQPHVSAASDVLDKLFTADWTIASQKAFDSKAKVMAAYVTEDVIKNSLDFKPDPDKMVTQTGVVMTYDHMDFLPTSASATEVKGKAIVFVKSHLKDSPDAMTRFVYNVSYNLTNHLINHLDRFGTFQLQSDSTVL